MGESKRRRQAQVGVFHRIDENLRRLGVDVSKFGFYDQPAFIALEQTDPIALEFYSNWVVNRPRGAEYDRHARHIIRQLAAIVERRLAAENGVSACINVATMMARMLDRLGVWSFAVQGSLTVEIPSLPSGGRRYFPECELLDNEDHVTGHGWLVAPPFVIVDTTLRHQRWVELHPAIAALLPEVVATETGEKVRPRWFDVVGDTVIRKHGIPPSERTPDLPYRAKPDLARIEKSLPGREIRIGDLALRYIAGAVKVSELPLEELPSLSPFSGNLTPIQIWLEDVTPQFAAHA